MRKKTTVFHGEQVLQTVGDEGEDYKLNEGSPSCWIEVDGIALYIRRYTNERTGRSFVNVEAYRARDEMGDEIDSFRVEIK